MSFNRGKTFSIEAFNEEPSNDFSYPGYHQWYIQYYSILLYFNYYLFCWVGEGTISIADVFTKIVYQDITSFNMTNSMVYGTGGFNATFTRALQYSLPLPGSFLVLIPRNFFKVHTNILPLSRPRTSWRSLSCCRFTR